MIELSSVNSFIIEYCDGAHPVSPSGDLTHHEITVSALKSVSAALIEVHDFIEMIRSKPLGMVRAILLLDASGTKCDEWPVPTPRPAHDEDVWRFMVVWQDGLAEGHEKFAYFAANKSMGFPSTAQVRHDAVLFSDWIERRGGRVGALWGHDGHHWVRLGRDGLMVSQFRQQAVMA